MEAKRFIVRVGDDGRPTSRHDTLGEARAAAITLSTEGWLGCSQIIDTADGWRESYRDGKVR